MLAEYIKYRKTLKCSKCGESRYYVLDFHHRSRAKKNKDVSRMANECYSLKVILKEIAKCDVLCANCHREVHFLENAGVA